MSGKVIEELKKQSAQLTQVFWQFPNRTNALRATMSMGLLAVPFIIAGLPFYGITLSLGALAAALSETNDHPKGRLKALSITVLSFFISSFSVGFLHNLPLLLGTGFVLSTIVFIIIGGLGERYRAISFGSILIGIYAMIGIDISPDWYWQGILLPVGALFHGLLSLLLFYRKPWRLLDEQMANGYLSLSTYLENKAKLFPSTQQEQAQLNNRLAQLNIGLVNALERIKDVLNNYGEEVDDPEQLRPYLQRFMLLQSLHERAASTHEPHNMLSEEKDRIEVMEGLGEMLRQLARATRHLAESMLTGNSYAHPLVLDWIMNAIKTKLDKLDAQIAQPLVLLHRNLTQSHLALKNFDHTNRETPLPRLLKDDRTISERIKSQLSLKHPRLRYALRLSLCFLIGFSLVEYFQLEKGAWVMLTSLFVSQITYSDTRRRLFQRLMGTLTGVVFGVLLLQIITTASGQVLLMLGSALAFFYWLKINYSIAVIFITTFVLAAFNLVSPDGGFHVMLPRVIDTILGASLSFLVIRFLWPGWQYQRIPALVSQAMISNAAYIKAIVKELNHADADDLAYRIARRKAHLADNELAQAWNSMRLEPKNKRIRMDHAFTYTHLNHSLLSYISALGAQRDNDLEKLPDLPGIISVISHKLEKVSMSLSGKEMQWSALPEIKAENSESALSATQLQQLRLLQNIAEVTTKIIKEVQQSKAN